MTVRDWIVSRTPDTVPALTRRVLDALGDDAGASESRVAELCLAAAARSLDTLVARSQFDRVHALDLLAIDALTTFAFEHASQSHDAGDDTGVLAALARNGATTLAHTLKQRV